ncbi:MAG: hypothetical protein K5770_16770 [Lachnospiraceae bacterium]|nr:hypothetical protein [Lachnospiraceae bacterium]
MGYAKNYATSHTTQFSVKGKFKSAAKIASANRHNKRIGREGQGVHIDKRREGLFEIQNEYAMSLAHLGYKRGEVASIRTSQISTKEYKAGLNRAVNAEYPKDLDTAKMEIRNLRAKNYELKTENRELVSSARTIQKLRISRHGLAEENERQKEGIDRLRRESERQRRAIEIMEQKYLLPCLFSKPFQGLRTTSHL